jgi:hypothetical protein
MTRGGQKVDARNRSALPDIAEGLDFGVAARDRIKIAGVSLGQAAAPRHLSSRKNTSSNGTPKTRAIFKANSAEGTNRPFSMKMMVGRVGASPAREKACFLTIS